MNFEKLIVKNKNNIILFFLIFLVIAFITAFLSSSNKVNFFYNTPLGRAYLIALLIILTRYNKYLGLFSVIFIALIYNSTDSIIENMENKDDDKKDDAKKDDKKDDSSNPLTSALSAVGAASSAASASLEGKKDEKKDDKVTVGQKVDMEDSIQKPKESFSLMSVPNLFKAKKEPRPNWSDNASYGLGFAPVN
jgi:hypothetical protein